MIKRFQLTTSKRGRLRATRILVAFLICNFVGRISLLASSGRMEFEMGISNQSKSVSFVQTHDGNAKERRRNSISRPQCYQTCTLKLAMESSLFCRFEKMNPAREDYDYGDNIYRTRDLSFASESAHDRVERSKLTTRKRGRLTVTRILVALLFFFIRRLFYITLRLGIFKFGARGFADVSACVGGLIIELGDAHGSNIVVARSQSKSLSCLSLTNNSCFIGAHRQQTNGNIFVDLRGFHEPVANPCMFLKGSNENAASKLSSSECTFAGNGHPPRGPSRTLTSGGSAIIDQFRKDNEDIIVLVYVDDCIILSRDKNTITKFISTLTFGPEKFEFTDEGELSKYLGVEIEQLQGGGFSMSQPFLIQCILDAVNIDMAVTKSRPTPAVGPLLSKDEQGPNRKYDWKYRMLTGMLGYLQGTSRPDISMGTHQCARFNAEPKLCHEKAIKRICKYLLATRDKGIIFKPDVSRGLECHVDADFAGGWADGDQSNPESVLSRAGYVISYAGCPIYWCSKMQTEIALSTTEAEYIALSMAMRDVLPFLNLMSEIKAFLPVSNQEPKFFCKVWEDNQSCIKVAKSPKFTPRTKHIALKYHHFRHFVSDGTIAIEYIDTTEQTADIFTKPLPEKAFRHLRKKLMGW